MTPPIATAPPLAAASQRLRGKPGRPRTQPAPAESGHSPGTPTPDRRVRGGSEGGAEASTASAPPLAPRLLDLDGAARYLSLSEWSIRDLIANGMLRRVRIPLPGHGEMRKILLDRADLDRVIEVWKAGESSDAAPPRCRRLGRPERA